jgi:hypothetical protein
MLAVGAVSALAHGTLQPLFIVVFGRIVDAFSGAPGDSLKSDVAGEWARC